MSYLHDHEILHKDLIPSNILLDDKLHPKLCDFGLENGSKIEELNDKNEDEKGTSFYISPEILTEKLYTNKSDIYSFSMILYEILVGTNILANIENEKETPHQIFNETEQGFRPPINRIKNKKFRELIENCWSEEMKKRPEFSEILNLLKNDDHFLLKNTDKKIYQNYVIDCTIGTELSGVDLDTKERISNALKKNNAKEMFLIGKKNYKLNKKLSNFCFEKADEISDDDFGLKYQIGKFIVNNRFFDEIEKIGFLSNSDRKSINYSLAKKVLKKSAKLGGNTEAMVLFGLLCQMDKEGNSRDFNKAYKYFKMAADRDDSNGLLHYGYFLKNGFNTEINKNDEIANECFEKAFNLDKNNPHAMAQYGLSLLKSGNEDEGLRLCFESKETDDPFALNICGAIEFNNRNFEEAFNCFKNAALKGNPAAINNLGSFYEKGYDVVDANVDVAKQLYKLALEEGAIFAACNLARLYLKEDDQKSADFYIKLACEYGFKINSE